VITTNIMADDVDAKDLFSGHINITTHQLQNIDFEKEPPSKEHVFGPDKV